MKTNSETSQAEKKEVFGVFEARVVCGDDKQYEGMRGKPNPDIFLVAAKEMLGRNVGKLVGLNEDGSKELSPEQLTERGKGLVLEDGLPGVQAGKRAGMNGKIPDVLSLDTLMELS